MFVYKLFIEYNGKHLFGSQKQSLNKSSLKTNNLRTVQNVLENVLSKLLKSKFKLRLASRTDAGVHALCNVGKLLCNEKLNHEQFLAKLNYFLPEDVQVYNIVKAKDFNPYNVRYKVYYYIIYNSVYTKPTVFQDYCWVVQQKISFSKLRKAAKLISAQKKFDFVTTKEFVEDRQNTRCKINISINKLQQFIILKFKGKRFTHRMIRNIVSLLVEIATGKLQFEQLKKIFKEWHYCKINPAPAKGLILVKIVN